MPELPEVQTIVNDLRENIKDFTILKAWVSANYPKIKDKQEFIAKVTGRKIVDVKRVAKNILIELDSGEHILIHLAMTGQVFLLDPSQKHGKRAHVVFQIKRGADNKILTFADTRMFGKMAVISLPQLEELKQKYGTEPIAPDLNTEDLYNSLQKRKTIIKNILMDQSIIAGLGNIYATEALFLAKIHPQTQMKNISNEKFHNLIEAAKNVLRMGIKNRGSTLPDKTYVDIWGNPGKQQNYFNIYLKDVCPVCNTKVSYIKIGGRGTYFCPVCQPLT